MQQESFDLTVIGGGPGGYTAAIRASQLGLKTALVEMDRPGGVCLNWGCIPSKAILHCAEIMETVQSADRYGIRCQGVSLDYGKVIQYSRQVADRLARGVEFLLKKNRVAIFAGHGTLLAPGEVLVEGAEKSKISSPKIILASGSRERLLPGLDIDGRTVLTSREALAREELPRSVLIIGGGAIGVEFAYAFKSFGVDTTVVEMMDRLLPEMDEELGRELERVFKKKKIRILTSTRCKTHRRGDGAVTVAVEGQKGDESELSAEIVLVAVGRAPLTEGLGLENLRIQTDRGFIRVDERYQTTCPGIYAVGDVTGPPLLAHRAAAEGIAAVEMMSGKDRKKITRADVPACVYCQPEVASIGMTENQAKEAGLTVKVGKFHFRAAGKAVATDHIDGWVKVVSAADGRIVGAQMIGKGVTELVAEAGLARDLGITVGRLAGTLHAHPTLSEAIMEASLNVMGEGINS